MYCRTPTKSILSPLRSEYSWESCMRVVASVGAEHVIWEKGFSGRQREIQREATLMLWVWCSESFWAGHVSFGPILGADNPILGADKRVSCNWCHSGSLYYISHWWKCRYSMIKAPFQAGTGRQGSVKNGVLAWLTRGVTPYDYPQDHCQRNVCLHSANGLPYKTNSSFTRLLSAKKLGQETTPMLREGLWERVPATHLQ